MNASATAMAAPAGRARRRARDWVVDTLMFLAAVLYGFLVIGGWLEASPRPEMDWLSTADLVAGALGCAGLWLRRRWPVGLALVLIALSTFSDVVAGAMVLALLTVAIHRDPRTTGAVYGLSVLAALVYVFVRPQPGTPPALLFAFGVVIQGQLSAGACSSTTGANSSCRCGTGQPGPRPRPSSGPSRPSSGPATRSPGRCTTSSATGCRY